MHGTDETFCARHPYSRLLLSPYRYFYTCKKPLITGLRRILIVVPARNEKNDRSPTSINVGVPKRNFTSNLP